MTSYIDWLKCESDIKVEESTKTAIKVEPADPPRQQTSIEKELNCDSIQDVRSLSQHSLTCQLRLSLESDFNRQSSETVMECCVSPTNQTVLLDVATPKSAIEIIPTSMQSVQSSTEVNVLSVATGEVDTLLPVATFPNTVILERPASIDILFQCNEKGTGLSVATTSENFLMELYGATGDKSPTEPITQHSATVVDI